MLHQIASKFVVILSYSYGFFIFLKVSPEKLYLNFLWMCSTYIHFFFFFPSFSLHFFSPFIHFLHIAILQTQSLLRYLYWMGYSSCWSWSEDFFRGFREFYCFWIKIILAFLGKLCFSMLKNGTNLFFYKIVKII